MGIGELHGQLDLFNEICRQERIVLSGLRMAELGNQRIRAAILGEEFPAKRLFKALGVTHTSIDLNGQDGALPLDLSQPIPTHYHGCFDLVTDFGTAEHVETSQYRCWRNVHEMCRPGGWMLHTLPEIGSWPRHGRWHYALGRLLKLAWVCGYGIAAARRHEYTHHDGRLQNSLLVCFIRNLASFIDEAAFQTIMFPDGQPSY
ncbi:MAG TPA: hypothetical protein VM118_09905 [Acidobacteriota bacterium]|nr:hypothetical protein [Acidobacteriota bacterium]